jgi:hypothetical protein
MKTIIFMVLGSMFLIGCAPVDPGRPRNAIEGALNGGTYVSNTDPVRKIEFVPNGNVVFRGICTFGHGSWWITDFPTAGPNHHVLVTHSAGYSVGGTEVPGYDRYCDPKKGKDICPQIKDICIKDTFPSVFTVSGNCITLRESSGQTEQFCR